jgi:hypothetical protein
LPLPLSGTPQAFRAAEPAPRARTASTTGGVVEALAGSDRDLGLGRGGPVVSAARDEAYRAPVPNESNAKIRVVFDREGRVVSADLVEASSGGDAWREVARATARSLASRPLALPANARSNGLEVTVLLVSKVRLPSGAKPGQAVTLTPLGGIFDLADIGAHPRRVMPARILEERWR